MIYGSFSFLNEFIKHVSSKNTTANSKRQIDYKIPNQALETPAELSRVTRLGKQAKIKEVASSRYIISPQKGWGSPAESVSQTRVQLGCVQLEQGVLATDRSLPLLIPPQAF